LVAGAGAGDGAGFVSLLLIKAQPPSVAATDAAVMSSFTPGALVLDFLTGLVGFISFTLAAITFRNAQQSSTLYLSRRANCSMF
jgi:ascorbate-specific PTS system EIIC-type component UlaA